MLTAIGVLLVFAAVAVGALLRQEQLATEPGGGAGRRRRGRRPGADGHLRPAHGDGTVRRPGAGPRRRHRGHRARGRPTSSTRRCWCSPTRRGWTCGSAARSGPPGHLSPADDPGWPPSSPPAVDPRVVAGPGRLVARGRRRPGVDPRRRSTTGRPSQRALVPALVDGDDAGLDPALAEDFRTTGLTHLLAVSGTNLTLVVGFLLVLARWCGVRGRWLYVVAAVGIVGFVLLARTEPSVVRAAAMGTVALLAMGTDGRQRGRPGARWRGRGPAARRPGAGGLGRVRAVGGRDRRDPAARPRLARRPAGAGCPGGWPRRSRSRPTAQLAVHAAGGRHLGAGQPGRGARQPAGRPGGRAGDRAGPGRRAGRARVAGCGCGPGHARGVVRGLDRRGRPARRRPADGGRRVGHRPGVARRCSPLADRRAWCWRRPRLLRRPVGGAAVLPGRWWSACWSGRPTPGWPPDGWVLAACDVGQGDALVRQRRAGQRPRGRRRPGPGRGGPAASTGSTWTGCRCSCSPTSTPTTSTGCPGCSTGARSGRSR